MLALFDRPSNRGNLGTILRSCDALGVEALIITGHAVDLYDPEVVVSSMGSFFRVPALRLTDNGAVVDFIAELKRRFDWLSGHRYHRPSPASLIRRGPDQADPVHDWQRNGRTLPGL